MLTTAMEWQRMQSVLHEVIVQETCKILRDPLAIYAKTSSFKSYSRALKCGRIQLLQRVVTSGSRALYKFLQLDYVTCNENSLIYPF